MAHATFEYSRSRFSIFQLSPCERLLRGGSRPTHFDGAATASASDLVPGRRRGWRADRRQWCALGRPQACGKIQITRRRKARSRRPGGCQGRQLENLQRQEGWRREQPHGRPTDHPGARGRRHARICRYRGHPRGLRPRAGLQRRRPELQPVRQLRLRQGERIRRVLRRPAHGAPGVRHVPEEGPRAHRDTGAIRRGRRRLRHPGRGRQILRVRLDALRRHGRRGFG